MKALIPKITDAGLAAVFNASNDGLEAKISHMAFGDGDTGSGVTGYAPTGHETALRHERARVPIGGGKRLSPHEVEVQALLDTGPELWVTEVGFYLEDGTLFAVWSDPDVKLGFKADGMPLVVALNLALQGVPPDSVNVTISGPSVNITMLENVVSIAANFMRTWRRMMASEVRDLTPVIERMWS